MLASTGIARGAKGTANGGQRGRHGSDHVIALQVERDLLAIGAIYLLGKRTLIERPSSHELRPFKMAAYGPSSGW